MTPAIAWRLALLAPLAVSMTASAQDARTDPPQAAWEIPAPYLSRPPLPDQQLSDPILIGAVDLHVHFGPDSYPRQLDAVEIARLAEARGVRALVFKNHWSESASTAFFARKYSGAERVQLFGGIALNTTLGGLNPEAIRYCLAVEGKACRIVWMPTHDSEHEVRFDKGKRPFVRVSRKGKLLPEALAVLDLVAQKGLTLATGHVGADEAVLLVEAAAQRGIRNIIFTHPGMSPSFTDPSMAQLRRVVRSGAMVEVVASQFVLNGREKMVALIRELGPEHCFVSSDSGLVGTPNITDALVGAIRTLREAGFSEAELDLMFRKNPARLIGLY